MIGDEDIQFGGGDPENRRGHRRLLCSDLITVSWASGRGFANREAAVLEDFSASGASVFIAVKIPTGVAIRIRTKWESFGAVVQWCVWRENGYMLGIQFDEPRLEGDLFTPDHLVDPEEIDA